MVEKSSLTTKIAWIINEDEITVGWDMSLEDQVFKLVQAYEKLADETGVRIYER